MAEQIVTFPLILPSTEKKYMTLSREGPLFILHHNQDNRFTTEVCKSIICALQVIEDIFLASKKPTKMALVTVGDSKFFSNSLDIKQFKEYIPFMRFLSCHATEDYRVTHTERGYMCVNEIDIGAPLHPGMNALLRYKTTPKSLRALVLQGLRFNAEEALGSELVDETYWMLLRGLH